MKSFWSGSIALILTLTIVTSPRAGDDSPSPENDYGRPKISGNQGEIVWKNLLVGEGFEGWRPRKGDEIVGWERKGQTVTMERNITCK